MLKVVCAWHSLYFPEDPTLVLDEFPNEPGGTSHGICASCNDQFMKDHGLEPLPEQPRPALSPTP